MKRLAFTLSLLFVVACGGGGGGSDTASTATDTSVDCRSNGLDSCADAGTTDTGTDAGTDSETAGDSSGTDSGATTDGDSSSGGTGCYMYARINPDNTRFTSYISAGLDGAWLTADDQNNGYMDYLVVASNKTRGIGYSVDGSIYGYDDITCKSIDKITRQVQYGEAGADGVWQSDDDVISLYLDRLYSSTGQLTRLNHYKSAGSDGVWFNSDDELIEYTIVTYNGSCRVRDVQHLPNGETTYYNERTCNDNGDTLTSVIYGAGPDGEWFTSDDSAQYFTKFIDNENGVPMRLIGYSGSGADGVMFTADDSISWYGDYKTK